MIIRSTNCDVFGGYTEKSWSDGPYYKKELNAFIFGYINIYLFIELSKGPLDHR